MKNFNQISAENTQKIIFDQIPFGFQYYRAPTPKEKYWERDLKKLSEDGYNTVKYWIQWRWNQPEYNRYDFSDIDKLMDLAGKYHLKVILNIILDVAPVWLEKRYPDVGMVTNSGEKVYGIATECRQIGGAPGPCFHHEEATALRMKFIEVCAQRYKDHPALAIWDAWNEPELTVGLRREPSVPDLMCYCPNSERAFQKWLEKKYGTIEKLNEIWGRNYMSFDDAEMPKRFGTTSDMIDWRLFFCDTITEDFRLRVQTIKKYDTVHPVMCHTVPPPIFNNITCCSDDFKIAEIGDLVGNSIGANDLASAILRSAAKGKTIINSEIPSVTGRILIGVKQPKLHDLLKYIFIPLVNGIRGFMFWQYSPEKLGMEAPAWGNIDLKGRDTEWDLETRRLHKFIQEEEASLLTVQNRPAEIGIYVDAKSEIGAWAMSMSTDLYTNSFMGMFKMFHNANYQVDFFTEKELFNGEVSRFKTICFPMTLCMNSETVSKIEEFAKNGGTVFLESYAGLIDTETGMHEEDLPGCGLAALSGLTLNRLYSAEMIDNSYENMARVVKDDLFPFTYKGDRICGGKYLITYNSCDCAEPIGNFENGLPVLYKTKVGNGIIYNSTTLISYGCNVDDESNPKQFLYDLFGRPDEECDIDFDYGIRFDAIIGTDLFVIRNMTGREKKLQLPTNSEDVFCVLTKQDGNYIVKPDQIAVFKIKK